MASTMHEAVAPANQPTMCPPVARKYNAVVQNIAAEITAIRPAHLVPLRQICQIWLLLRTFMLINVFS
jgi:hypothetical protein